jgi:glycosyltransferase involved in cell wall biosynthesis
MTFNNTVMTQTLDVPPQGGTRPIKTRRVLVISYDFPPNRTSAVYRMTGLTRSLPQYGWQPTVLTIEGGDFAQEAALLEKLPPEVEIARTKFLSINGWENKTAGAIQSVGGLQPAFSGTRKSRRLDDLLRSCAALVRSTLYFPDETVGWIPYALSKAVKLHRKNPFDVIWTTNPPRSAPVVGLLLKSLFGIPLVTEFMDPWYPKTRPLRRKSEEWLVKRLLNKSERIIVMVRQHAEELVRSFNVPAEKLVVVRNGFFEEDFTAIENLEPNDLDPAYFHLSHFGTIYPGNQGNFFIALAELIRERPELKNQIRLHLVGFPCEDVLRYAKESELRDITEVHGFLPKREDTLQMMRSSDCLVVCWGRLDFSQLAIAGKTYDYLRAGRPIIAVSAQGGGIEELIEQGQAGWVVPPSDTEGIKRVLRQVFSDLQKKRLDGPARPEYVAEFRWDRLAEPLAKAFDDAVGHAT